MGSQACLVPPFVNDTLPPLNVTSVAISTVVTIETITVPCNSTTSTLSLATQSSTVHYFSTQTGSGPSSGASSSSSSKIVSTFTGTFYSPPAKSVGSTKPSISINSTTILPTSSITPVSLVTVSATQAWSTLDQAAQHSKPE